jgi:CheY-like chemotaxis protein/HPt (histidine-containing phosphotransfer) domain-containing protein
VTTLTGRIIVEVDPLLRDLVPVYLINRRGDIDLIRIALDRADFETIGRIGHNMQGSGASFGFEGLSTIGAELERAAKAGKRMQIGQLLDSLDDYLSHLDVRNEDRDVIASVPDTPVAATASTIIDAEAGPLGSPEVLVVDDQEMNAAIMSRYLTRAGYAVKCVASGDAALELLEKGLRPALILLDVIMVGISGFDVCRRIKANPATCRIPVVLVTSFDRRSDFMQGWAAGADDVLAKPVQRDDLMARVRSLVRPTVVRMPEMGKGEVTKRGPGPFR